MLYATYPSLSKLAAAAPRFLLLLELGQQWPLALRLDKAHPTNEEATCKQPGLLGRT